MKREKGLEEKTVAISGKDLCTLMGVRVKDYVPLYPRRDTIDDYCACMDLGDKPLHENCNGMLTVMQVLTKNELAEFPEATVKVSDGEYKSGEVWIDKCEKIAYLLVGQLPNKKDVVLNLGGETYNQGNFEIGYINGKKPTGRIHFDKKVFPL
jgi:hypothetical protein